MALRWRAEPTRERAGASNRWSEPNPPDERSKLLCTRDDSANSDSMFCNVDKAQQGGPGV
jgi:hypothetical protein